MKIISTLLLILAFSTALAADYPRDITFSWTNADSYEDGTLIDPGDLTEVRIVCLRNGQPSFSATFPVNGEGLAQSATISAVPSPGNYTCVGISIIFDGTESIASNEAAFKYTGKPLPPINLS